MSERFGKSQVQLLVSALRYSIIYNSWSRAYSSQPVECNRIHSSRPYTLEQSLALYFVLYTPYYFPYEKYMDDPSWSKAPKIQLVATKFPSILRK